MSQALPLALVSVLACTPPALSSPAASPAAPTPSANGAPKPVLTAPSPVPPNPASEAAEAPTLTAEVAGEEPAPSDASPALLGFVDPFAEDDAPPRCPREMTLVLDRVCVDRWEATLVERLPGGEERPWSAFESVDHAATRVRAVSQPDVIPQGYISGVQAERACRVSGKRLCTAREWEAACRGPERTQFPYGRMRQANVCNDDGRALHPVAEVTRRLGLPQDRMWYEGMDHPLINQLENTLDRTGQRQGCTNVLGAFDMVGNLHEWIDDPDGTFRGGYYMDTRRNGEGCDYATTAHEKGYHDYSTGFRCCLDADAVE